MRQWWLSEQDSDVPFSERPAFVSWWDYGFQALASEITLPWQTTSVRNPEQRGNAPIFRTENTLSLFISTLAFGDRKLNDMELGADFLAALEPELSENRSRIQAILSNEDREFLETRRWQ